MIRHELAHQHLRELAGDQATWLSEGLADWVESSRTPAQVDAAGLGRLLFPPAMTTDQLPVTVVVSLSLAKESGGIPPVDPTRQADPPAKWPPLEELFNWREDGKRIVSGEERPQLLFRQMAPCFVAFLLSADDAGKPFPERVVALTQRHPAELLALEAEFRAWHERWREQLVED